MWTPLGGRVQVSLGQEGSWSEATKVPGLSEDKVLGTLLGGLAKSRFIKYWVQSMNQGNSTGMMPQKRIHLLHVISQRNI